MINPLCNSRCDIKFSAHFFEHCTFFINERCTLVSNISSIDTKLFDNTDSVLKQNLLFGNGSHNLNNDFKITTTSTEYLLSTYRFDKPLLWNSTFCTHWPMNLWTFFCKVCKIFQNTFFTEQLWVIAFENSILASCISNYFTMTILTELP